MKKIILILSLAILFCLNSNSQSISIRDFQLPITQAERLYFTGNLDYSGTDSMTTVADINLIYYRFYSSLPLSYSITGNLIADYGKWKKTDEKGKVLEIETSILPTINADIQKYLNVNNDFFLGGKTNISYFKLSANEGGNLMTVWGAGAGYGRIIVATGMAQALRIQEYLLSEKLISGEFDKDIIIEMASHCSKLGEYAIKFGDKHPIDWFMDLEKILVKSGKLIDGRINPYALFRIQEVLNKERIYDRKIGWRVTGYLNYYYNEFIPKSEHDVASDKYGVSLSFDIGYPISNKLQLNHSTSYDYSKEFKQYFNGEFNTILSSTALTYNLTNLIDLSLNYNFSSYNYSLDGLSKTQSMEFSFYYYIENNIFLNLSAILKNRFVNASMAIYNEDITTKSIKLNLGYRFF